MRKTIKRAYKFRFYPQKELVILLAKTFGCSRFIYNYILDYCIKHYHSKEYKITDDFGDLITIPNKEYKSLSGNDRINYIKILKQNSQYSFLNEISSIALQQSVKHLNTAYEKFFNKEASFPQFKKKINKNSFTITGKNSIHFSKDFLKDKEFYLPKYNKSLKIKFSRDFNHLAVSSYTVSQEPSGKYYISFLVEEDIIEKDIINISNNTKQKTSIDLGLKTHAKTYNGKEFQNCNLPKSLKNIDVKIRKNQRLLSSKEKGSKNRNKQRIKVARLHEKRNNIISDYYQKLSSTIINENQDIVLEDLNIKGMVKNRKLSKNISNVAWGKFLNMLNYKADWHNRNITRVNRFYPSSKECSKCGHINHGLKLSHRTWQCPNIECNAIHDRDENACINLYNYDEIKYQSDLKYKYRNKKLSKTTVGAMVKACGGNIRPEVSRIIRSKKKKALPNETRILVL